MQLSRAALLTLLVSALGLSSLGVRADGDVDATSTVFYESGGNLHMTVINPSVQGRVGLGEHADLSVGWDADIVTGASVAIVDSPGTPTDVDAITSATVLKDVRHVFRGGLRLLGDDAYVSGSYGYGFESDYRSHTLVLQAGSELYGRNTAFDITYVKGWDSVCDLAQSSGLAASERARLPTSDGCFSANDRASRELSRHALQGSWTQAWGPLWNTQLVLSTQLLRGFQSNPYRAIWIGTAAQEHHPDNRARFAVGLGTRIWLRPIGGALQIFGRGYRDTWNVTSFSAELGYERNLGELFRARVRGRYYQQTAAAFYSDDYTLAPAGQYFTGDRELSDMRSYLAGARLEFIPRPQEDGSVAGFLQGLTVVLKADWLQYAFESFRYGTQNVPNNRAILGTLGVEATF